MHDVTIHFPRVAVLLAVVVFSCSLSALAGGEGVAFEFHCIKEVQDKHGINPEEMHRMRASITLHQMQMAQMDVYVVLRQVPEWKKSVKKGYPVESWVEIVATGGVVLKSRVTPSDWAALDREISRAIERCMAECAKLRKQSKKAPLTVYNL